MSGHTLAWHRALDRVRARVRAGRLRCRCYPTGPRQSVREISDDPLDGHYDRCPITRAVDVQMDIERDHLEDH